MMGSFEQEFLSIPSEVIRATIRTNMKCFVVSDPATSKLTNKFILTANIEAPDGGKTIVGGNERVIRARLSDAKFFYETDLKTKLENRLPNSTTSCFTKSSARKPSASRGSNAWPPRSRRWSARTSRRPNARRIWRKPVVCSLKWLDLKELQGLMGKYYALAQGEDASVAAASEEHYKPQGPADRMPSRSGEHCRGVGGQDRHAGRFLGD